MRATHGTVSYLRTGLAHIVDCPPEEPRLHPERQAAAGRQVSHTTRSYGADKPSGERYQ